MKLLSNQVLIKPSEKIKKIGSLILASSSQENDHTGTVLQVGPGKLTKNGNAIIPMSVIDGDIVTYIPTNAVSITYNNTAHLLISEDDILAVM